MFVARKAITAEIDAAIPEAVALGFVPKLAALLQAVPDDQIRAEVLWSLSNVAGSLDEYTEVVRSTGVQFFVVELLKTCSMEVKEKGLFALGNIIANSIETRDKLLDTSLLETLYEIFISTEASKPLIDSASWVFSTLAQGKPSPPLDKFTKFFPLLKPLLSFQSKGAVNDTLWTISYLTDRNAEAVDKLIDFIDFPVLVKVIAGDDIKDVTPALRIVGNVCTTDNEEIVKKIHQLHILDVLQQLLLRDDMKQLHRETCWVLSNIAMGPSECLVEFFESKVFELLVNCAMNYPNQEVLQNVM